MKQWIKYLFHYFNIDWIFKREREYLQKYFLQLFLQQIFILIYL